MSVHSKTFVETIYTIICDYCGRKEEIVEARYLGKSVYNCRQAVRSLGWSCGRKNNVKCNTCRCYNARLKINE